VKIRNFVEADASPLPQAKQANIECDIGDAAGGKGEDVGDEKISKFEVEGV